MSQRDRLNASSYCWIFHQQIIHKSRPMVVSSRLLIDSASNDSWTYLGIATPPQLVKSVGLVNRDNFYFLNLVRENCAFDTLAIWRGRGTHPITNFHLGCQHIYGGGIWHDDTACDDLLGWHLSHDLNFDSERKPWLKAIKPNEVSSRDHAIDGEPWTTLIVHFVQLTFHDSRLLPRSLRLNLCSTGQVMSSVISMSHGIPLKQYGPKIQNTDDGYHRSGNNKVPSVTSKSTFVGILVNWFASASMRPRHGRLGCWAFLRMISQTVSRFK